MLIFIYNFFSC